MKKWLFWAGVGFIVGGTVSYALTVGVTGTISGIEDTSGYSIGWICAGAVLLIAGLVKRR